jgi:hypothetical protein
METDTRKRGPGVLRLLGRRLARLRSGESDGLELPQDATGSVGPSVENAEIDAWVSALEDARKKPGRRQSRPVR